MNRFFKTFTILSLLTLNHSYADGLGGSSKIENLKPLEKATQVHPTQTVKSTPTSAPPQVAQTNLEASYFYPGTIVSRGNTWVGGDNLLNLPKNIGLYLNIIKPEKDTLVFDEEAMLKDIAKIFEKANISPRILVNAGQPPLPFFQIQVLLYPIEKGYAAACEGRLFESVELKRFYLEPAGMAFQAITWQKSSLVVSPTNIVAEQLKKDIEDLAQSFADRYQAFENIKKNL